MFLTAILHRGLRNCFFLGSGRIFFFYILFGLLFFFSIWTFIFPFLFGLLFPFSLWTFIPFYFPFSLDFIQAWSHLGFLPNFLVKSSNVVGIICSPWL